MTPEQFQTRWTNHGYTEKQGYTRHFNDLCAVAGFDPPNDHERFTFEKQVKKLGGTAGAADVWLKGHFGMEYKGTGADLQKAYLQLQAYRDDLENPPLLVVSDMDTVEVWTNFQGTKPRCHSFTTATIGTQATQRILTALFTNPSLLDPRAERERITETAARRMAEVLDTLVDRGLDAHDAAHFLMKLVFCFFAEDARLLPTDLVTKLLATRADDPPRLAKQLTTLFGAMAEGGDFGADVIDYFNGGLFDDAPTLLLTTPEARMLSKVGELDWAQVEPSIFGSLFEGALTRDQAKRRRLGAHYTSRSDIELIIEPVLMAPLRAEWAAVQAECDQLAGTAKGKAKVPELLDGFLTRLAGIRVLDPACGSGNFLYVALAALLDLEWEVANAATRWGLQRGFVVHVDPRQLLGLDIEPYAIELAKLTVSIGYLQWLRDNSGLGSERPLLKNLDGIRCADAILNEDGTEPEWPECFAIVGNPPFLGDKKMRADLGDGYVERLRGRYEGRVPGGADLCCYWFDRARTDIEAGRAGRAGLLATNSIRQGLNRAVLDEITRTGGIFEAWSDKDWVLDGAAVRISIVGFDNGSEVMRRLDGVPITTIGPGLSPGADLSAASRLFANRAIAFLGNCKGGPFDPPTETARSMLSAPINANGRPNSDVVVRYLKGADAVRRQDTNWLIDFYGLSETDASFYEAPFEYVRLHVYPLRANNPRKAYRERWWIHQEARPSMRAGISRLRRFIVTPTVSKHRVFVWVPAGVMPDHQLIVFAREDDYFFGVVQSRVHKVWSLRMASWLGVGNDPRYTPTTCFETFPFPEPNTTLVGHPEVPSHVPTPEQMAAVGDAARQLDEARRSRLAGDPKLTMTGLYNAMPQWLKTLHANLDAAVLAAYGWPADISDEELLEKLLALNLERAAAEGN